MKKTSQKYTPKKTTSREKKLKKAAHDLCNIIWGDTWSAFGNIALQYKWLQDNTRTGHIGSLNESELEDLIKKLKKIAKKNVNESIQQWWK